MKRIEVVAYNPNWPNQFAELRKLYEYELDNLIQRVEHVGSTSVPGLAAKPILDIDLVIKDWDVLPLIIDKLNELGYTYQGDLGVKDRESFKRQDEYVPYSEPQRAWPIHHLYVCIEGGEGLVNHITLRNYLRAHPEKVEEYAQLKQELAARYTYDIDAYVEGKTQFIMSIVGASLPSQIQKRAGAINP